jgi:hypothetical protein
MKVGKSSETLVTIRWTTWHHIQGDSNLHSRRRKNFKSYIRQHKLSGSRNSYPSFRGILSLYKFSEERLYLYMRYSSNAKQMSNIYLWHDKKKFVTRYLRCSFKLQADKFITSYLYVEPPLWSSGQSSWLQIQRSPGFDSRRYQIFWEVVVLERGPLRLVRIIEELLKK